MKRTDPIYIQYIIGVYSSVRAKYREDGGPGSGNWGHEGVEGQRGGSAPGGGAHNRQAAEGGGYTSFSKQKKALAMPHEVTEKELVKAPAGTKLLTGKYGTWIKKSNSVYVKEGSGIEMSTYEVADACKGRKWKMAVPDSASPNYSKHKAAAEGTDDAFSSERKSHAIHTSNKEYVDSVLREDSGKVWNSLSNDEKDALYKYTSSGYRSMNDTLRGKAGELTAQGAQPKINAMTAAIDKSALNSDIYLTRGVSAKGAAGYLGLNEDEIYSGTANVKSLIGKTVQDKAFMSCGSAIDSGFDDKIVVCSIYAPKGTKAIYAEPFSACGSNSDPRHWDGKSRQKYYSSEFETILQRGTKCRITDAKYDGKRFKIEMEVVGQEHE